jgi:UDP:flavonoid glycosyltransferase YjiC (YdhE family)
MIEPLLHQIWHPFSAAELPRDWRRFAETWRRWHPGHRYILWGPEESRRFVAEFHPDFLATYDAYPKPIQRVDSLRILLLQHFGGIYADLDVECLRNVGPLLEGRRLVLTPEPGLHSQYWRGKGFRRVISTAFMASEAGHPFWAGVKEELKRSAVQSDVMESTGPFVLTRCFERFPDRVEITLAPPETFYPVNEPECRDGTALDLESWVRTTAGAYGVHHWASSWKDPGRSARPALRPYHLGLPAKLRHPALHRDRPGQLLEKGPLVSCLMVTRGWREPARWSVDCFRSQTYSNRELVVVTSNADGDLRAHLDELRDPRIRFADVAPHGASLGALRNLAVAHARGEILCTWDDDDLFGADRLAASVTALLTSGAAAAFLERVTMWWPARQELTVSLRHAWENTMVAHRAVVPRYPDLPRAEDTEVAARIAAANPVVLLDDPNLFVYVVTGNNTWGPEHFQRFFDRATFTAAGLDYPRALSVLAKHVPVLDYLEWLQRRDPRTFDPPPRAAPGAAPAGDSEPRASLPPRPTSAAANPTGGPLRFLFAWELGGGLGHTVPLAQLARPLLDAGHEVHLVLQDLSTARAGLGTLAQRPGLRLWQAPTWPAALRGNGDPACYADLLFVAGYLDPGRLNGLVLGWETLLRSIDPDLLLADNAPTALLAARGHRCARALAGTGFFEPPAGTPMPTYRDWEPIPASRIESSEERALAACNEILSARALPLLGALQDLLAADERFLLTVPELDHFPQRARDPGQRYWGCLPPASQGQPARFPRGREPAVFAYVKGHYARIAEVLRALHGSPWRVLAYVPGCPPELAASCSSSRCAIVTEPVDMVEVTNASDAVVCNSGSGTVASALHAAKPVVMLPMHVEQFLVARRVQEMGAGLLVLEDRMEKLSGALRQVVEDTSFRDAARAFAHRHATPAANTVAAAVAVRVEELARNARRRGRKGP